MKTVILRAEDVVLAAAQELVRLVREKPQAAIAFTDDDELVLVLDHFFSLCNETDLDCSELRFFACSDIPHDPVLNLIQRKGYSVIVPDSNKPEQFDRILLENGGIDLQLLSVGCTGRIAYNEPAVPFNSVTHLQKVTDRTKSELIGFFKRNSIPDVVCTAGIQTLLSAKTIIVVAIGAHRAESLFRTLYARTDSTVPGAFLQVPLNVVIFADSDAAAKL